MYQLGTYIHLLPETFLMLNIRTLTVFNHIFGGFGVFAIFMCNKCNEGTQTF